MHKVMLVDDEGFARQGLRSMIDWEACGYEVCAEAEDGEEALRMIGEHAPDLVITDIRMPVLSGLELIRAVRGTGNRSVKFIIVSGYGDFSYAQQAIKFGVRDFILKPVDDAEMMEALQGLAAQIEKDEQAGERSSRQSRTALESLLRGMPPAKSCGGMGSCWASIRRSHAATSSWKPTASCRSWERISPSSGRASCAWKSPAAPSSSD